MTYAESLQVIKRELISVEVKESILKHAAVAVAVSGVIVSIAASR